MAPHGKTPMPVLPRLLSFSQSTFLGPRKSSKVTYNSKICIVHAIGFCGKCLLFCNNFLAHHIVMNNKFVHPEIVEMVKYD